MLTAEPFVSASRGKERSFAAQLRAGIRCHADQLRDLLLPLDLEVILIPHLATHGQRECLHAQMTLVAGSYERFLFGFKGTFTDSVNPLLLSLSGAACTTCRHNMHLLHRRLDYQGPLLYPHTRHVQPSVACDCAVHPTRYLLVRRPPHAPLVRRLLAAGTHQVCDGCGAFPGLWRLGRHHPPVQLPGAHVVPGLHFTSTVAACLTQSRCRRPTPTWAS